MEFRRVLFRSTKAVAAPKPERITRPRGTRVARRTSVRVRGRPRARKATEREATPAGASLADRHQGSGAASADATPDAPSARSVVNDGRARAVAASAAPTQEARGIRLRRASTRLQI